MRPIDTLPREIRLWAVPGVPEIRPGDDLVEVITKALDDAGMVLQDEDVVIVTQKVVSKAEACFVDLTTVEPSPRALQVAADVEKDPRLVEVILSEAARKPGTDEPNIVRWRRGTLIVETHHGWICANAGVDRSNVSVIEPEGDKVAGIERREVALTLPQDPDASAHQIRGGLVAATGADVAVLITDTYGRPWRLGTVNFAIGVAGMAPIVDLRGRSDRAGYRLRITTVAQADELAAAAGLLSGQAAEGLPVVVVRGVRLVREEGKAADLQRPVEKDLFR